MFGKEKSFPTSAASRVAPECLRNWWGRRASSAGVLLFSAVLFVVVLACVLGVCALATGRVTLGLIIVAALAALLAIGCRHIAQQWERVVVLRPGALTACRGPGLFWTIPVIESNTMRVDTRTRVTTFYAEETLTTDLVPMNVDAVLFWHVGRRRGLHRSGRLHPRRGDGGPNGPARRHRPGKRRRGGHPPQAAGSGSSNGCWRRRWRPGA